MHGGLGFGSYLQQLRQLSSAADVIVHTLAACCIHHAADCNGLLELSQFALERSVVLMSTVVAAAATAAAAAAAPTCDRLCTYPCH
jgi:hypothetical protein